MKKLLPIFILLALSSCRQQASKSKEIGDNYRVRIIDGCEYLEFESSVDAASNYSYSFTHKGNCNNPIHKTNPVQ